MKQETRAKFESTVQVGGETITFRYWGFQTPLTTRLKEFLTDRATYRASYCIEAGFREGELHVLYTEGYADLPTSYLEEEIQGWWGITTSE